MDAVIVVFVLLLFPSANCCLFTDYVYEQGMRSFEPTKLNFYRVFFKTKSTVELKNFIVNIKLIVQYTFQNYCTMYIST